MPKKKNIPMRMCIACREMKPKVEMTRVVRNAEGEISPDPTGKAPGRGAYICSSEDCLKKLMGKRLLHKAFSADVSLEVYKGVEEDALGQE